MLIFLLERNFISVTTNNFINIDRGNCALIKSWLEQVNDHISRVDPYSRRLLYISSANEEHHN